ncbi:MAG: hypothetical protein AAF266_01735 [Planctomycetota bacterium]
MLLIETITVAAVLLAWCGLAQVTPPEGATVGAIAVAALTVGTWQMMSRRRRADRQRRLAAGDWWGLDAAIRHLATPLALGGCLALVVLATLRADVGAKLGGAGSLLVLLVVIAIGAKFVAETYLFAQLGGDPKPRQASAQALNGPLSGPTKLRYALGSLGGIVLPLGAQLLAGGAKNIPPVSDAGPPALLAAVSLLLLVPGELLERRLFWRAVGPAEPASAEGE